MEQNIEILETFENEAEDGEKLERLIRRMSLQEQDRAISVLGERKAMDEDTSDEKGIYAKASDEKQSYGKASDEKDATEETPNKKKENESDEWEDVGVPSSPESQLTVTTARIRHIGSKSVLTQSRSSEAATAKARQVMGMDEPESKVPSPRKGKGKKGKKSKIMFMLHA